MSLLEDLKTIFSTLEIPVETGEFSDKAPSEYVVLIPINDDFEFYDDKPEFDVQAVRISLFTKQNYTKSKKDIITSLIAAGITISDRFFVGYDSETKYYQYSIDVENFYIWED